MTQKACTLVTESTQILSNNKLFLYELDRFFSEAELIKDEIYLSPIESTKCDVYDFIKNIKIAISRKKGIPYALHDSLGDFLFNHSEKRVINYDEFCEHIRDGKRRTKFLPVINFWTGLVENDHIVDQVRLRKIRLLIGILELLNRAEIREGRS